MSTITYFIIQKSDCSEKLSTIQYDRRITVAKIMMGLSQRN